MLTLSTRNKARMVVRMLRLVYIKEEVGLSDPNLVNQKQSEDGCKDVKVSVHKGRGGAI